MTIGQRLKQLRLASGLSLDAMKAKMGGLVTKQALSKYETCKSIPSIRVLNAIAKVFNVKISYLWETPDVNVHFISYRKGYGLSKNDENRVKNLVSLKLEERIFIQDILNENKVRIPNQSMKIKNIDESEEKALELRAEWNLGTSPISNLSNVLESNQVYVVNIDAPIKFEGVSAIAYNDDKEIVASMVVARKNVCGERQRLSLAHELGHIVLDVPKKVDEEGAAFRFGGAFLMPAIEVYKYIGNKRSYISIKELLLLKKIFGMSVQAILYRLRDLHIIKESYFKQWCMDINRIGWKHREPQESEPEDSGWLQRNLLRALSEGLITKEKAENILNKEIKDYKENLSLINRKSFMALTLEERRNILKDQAEKSKGQRFPEV